MTLTACDVSEHQGSVVNDSYPHRWLIFRACFGGDLVDGKLAGNLAWSKGAKVTGRLDGYTAYVVYLPGQNQAILALLDREGVPRDCHIMIDAEKWEGQSYQINGDHSTEINQLADALATRQGSRDRVWGYGNRGPDLEVWPRKPAWLGWVVASYGGTKPNAPNLIGWQYTDGQYTVPGLPNSSTPFGACDHNQLYITEGLTMDPDVKARFDKIDADYLKLWARLNSLFAVDTDGDGKPDITGTVQGADAYALKQYASFLASVISAGVFAKLPAASKGGLTQSDVSAAVKAALQEGTGK